MFGESVNPLSKVQDLRKRRVEGYRKLLQSRHSTLSKDERERDMQLEEERARHRQQDRAAGAGGAGPSVKPEDDTEAQLLGEDLFIADEGALQALLAEMGAEDEYDE